MDEATREFLALMAESMESSRILLCVTHRTGFALTFGEGVFQTRLTMSRLSQAETTAIAGALLGVPVLSPELQRLLDAKTDGNPFFVEEVVRSLLRKRCARATGRHDRSGASDGNDRRSRHDTGRHSGAARAARFAGARHAARRIGDWARILAPRARAGRHRRRWRRFDRRSHPCVDRRRADPEGARLARSGVRLQACADAGGRVPGSARASAAGAARPHWRGHRAGLRGSAVGAFRRAGLSLHAGPAVGQGARLPACGGAPGGAELCDARSARAVRRGQIGGRAAGWRRRGCRDAHRHPRGEGPSPFRQERLRAVGCRS